MSTQQQKMDSQSPLTSHHQQQQKQESSIQHHAVTSVDHLTTVTQPTDGTRRHVRERRTPETQRRPHIGPPQRSLGKLFV